MNDVWCFQGMCFVVQQALFYLQAYCSSVTQSGIPWPSSDSPQHIVDVGCRELKWETVNREPTYCLAKSVIKKINGLSLVFTDRNGFLSLKF